MLAYYYYGCPPPTHTMGHSYDLLHCTVPKCVVTWRCAALRCVGVRLLALPLTVMLMGGRAAPPDPSVAITSAPPPTAPSPGPGPWPSSTVSSATRAEGAEASSGCAPMPRPALGALCGTICAIRPPGCTSQ